MDWVGLGWDGLDLCVGLFYEHRFAVLITDENPQILLGALLFRYGSSLPHIRNPSAHLRFQVFMQQNRKIIDF